MMSVPLWNRLIGLGTAMADGTFAQNSKSGVRWSLRLLGGFELRHLPSGERITLTGKRERALLAYLALSPRGRQPRRLLAGLIWGDATDQTLLDNLRTSIWRTRKAFGETGHSLLASEDEEVVLDVAALDIDILAFRRLSASHEESSLET